jgi:phospholipid N-methyltransferase
MSLPLKFLSALLAMAPFVAAGADVARTGGPYVPTPPAVVEAMLKLANVGPSDYVIDLGSGDGRIVLLAATKFNAKGVGYDIDPDLVAGANASAKKQGVADRAKFEVRDVLKADVSRATVMTLYLLPGMMSSLQKKLLSELAPGTRIVSHDFTFESWKPERSVTVDTDEKYNISGSWTSEVHLYIVPDPAKAAK